MPNDCLMNAIQTHGEDARKIACRCLSRPPLLIPAAKDFLWARGALIKGCCADEQLAATGASPLAMAAGGSGADGGTPINTIYK